MGERGRTYTLRVPSTNHEISFHVPNDEQPPQKIRFHDGSTSVAVFNFDKKISSYVELTKDELERFDRGFKTGRCRHPEAVNRETGDERLDKRLTKLQKKLKEKKSSGDHCSFCEEYGSVVNFKIQQSGLLREEGAYNDAQINILDDLKLSEPEAASLGPSSIKISWKESVANNDHLGKCTFELQMSKSKNSSFHTVYSGSEQSFTQMDLLPGSKYYFRLRAVIDSLEGPFSPEVCALTEATAPSTPDVPHISSKTRTSLVLKWTTKSDNGSPITSYILQLDEGSIGNCFQTIYEGTQKQYKFNHKLAPMATCRFRVKAINKIGESEFSPELLYTAAAGVPSTPDPPTLVKSTSKSMELSWRKPNDNGAEITEYILQMDDHNKGYGFLPVYRGSDVTCVVKDNLKRNTTYKFRLSAINSQGDSKWSDVITHSTLSEAPARMSAPVLEGKVHTKSFAVTWEPPVDDGGCKILSYTLEICDGKGGSFNEVYTGPDMNYKFQNLLPGHMHSVRVSCRSSFLQSPWSEVANIETLPVIPDPPSLPRESKCHKPQPYSIELHWDPPTYNGGANINNYDVQMKQSHGEDFKHIYLGAKNYCCARGLIPDCEYSFRVRARNIAGDSRFSDVSVISTGPGPPDVVEQVEMVCRSSNAIKLSWKVPKDNGTPVTGYLLEWAKNSTGPFEKLYCGVDNNHEVKKKVLPFTVYYCRVQASSAAGYGDWSDVVSCKTPAAPPAQVTHLTVVRQTSTSLTLQWRLPHNNGAAITSYNIDVIGHEMISLLPEECENDETEDDGDRDSCILEHSLLGLQPHTQYRFRVQGVNKSGCGAFSSVVSADTGSVAPGAPILEIVSSSYQSVKLHWKFSHARSETSELNYDLQIKRKDTASFETVFERSATSHKVGKLQEQTTHSFRVRAANEAGYGPYSEVLVCETGAQPPSIAKGLHYSNLTSNQVTLSWKEIPPMQSTDRMNYILQWQRKDVGDLEQIYEGNQTTFTCNNLAPGQSYSFRVCAVRILVDGRRLQSAFTSLVSLTAPSMMEQKSSEPRLNQDSQEKESQVIKFVENNLAVIFFVGFAVIVLLMSFLISFLVT